MLSVCDGDTADGVDEGHTAPTQGMNSGEMEERGGGAIAEGVGEGQTAPTQGIKSVDTETEDESGGASRRRALASTISQGYRRCLWFELGGGVLLLAMNARIARLLISIIASE